MKVHEQKMLAFLKNDPFGRYFLPGYGHMKFVSPDATVSRRNIDTLYVHLLLWKPLLHVLVFRTLWEEKSVALYWNFELKHGERVFTFKEFSETYNRCFPPLLAPFDDEDLHEKAKAPISAKTLTDFHEFCTKGQGKNFIELHTTHRPDLVQRLENL